MARLVSGHGINNLRGDMSGKRVLIIYYSFSSQTHLLVQRFASGLTEGGVEVVMERLHPVDKMPFPFMSTLSLLRAMTTSFFRKRIPIKDPVNLPDGHWDLVVLSGPTWSYNPSGPVLAFLDRYGESHFKDKDVLPLISCRAYWQINYSCIKKILIKGGARVLEPLVYFHCAKEPWRTTGLVLQMLGRLPRGENSWFRKKYTRYGHSFEQFETAKQEGLARAAQLLSESGSGE